MSILVEKGKDLDFNKAANCGWDPLYAACYKGYADVVSILSEKGKDLDFNKATNNESPPL